MPLVYYTEPEHRLDHAFVGWWEDPEHGWVHAYDALHDRVAMGAWLRGFTEEEHGALTFHRVPGHDLDPDATSTLFSGEQSNSSVFFGEDAILKVFRKVTPGINPDIEIHQLLTEAGSSHVAALYGWVECRRSSEESPRGRRSSSRCSSSSCAPPPTAGTSPWPASATSSPTPTCTPTRPVATSPPRPPGWARR